jgi:surface polysaccharide O-acyltransferase-like enzyme
MTTETIKVDREKSGTVAAEARSVSKTRLAYVDKLRVALTMLVVAHHAAQAYGPTGGGWPITNPTTSRLLSPFFTVNAMFFMGLFFLIAGYFVPRSFDRKGGGEFLKGRFVRLGIPALFVAWVIFAPIFYLLMDLQLSLPEYVRYLYSTNWTAPYMHLWFLLHLILYSIGYLLWRQISNDTKRNVKAIPLPSSSAILLFIIVLALVTFVVRIWYPIDVWVALFYLVPAEVAHLPQYIALFALGILAYRGDWLNNFPTRAGMAWLGIGLFGAVAFYAYSLWGAQLIYDLWGISLIETGGLDWRSLVFSTWEALVCVGLCIGLLVLFRERFNKTAAMLMAAMIGAAYTVYIIHILIVIGLQAGFESLDMGPFMKFVLVTILAICLSFIIGILIKKIPGAKKIL